MKVATITYSWAQNWGAVLQAYALTEYLNSVGHEAMLIDYKPFDNKLISTVKSVPDGILDLLTIPASKRRVARYNEFRKNAFRLTEKCNTTEELEKLNSEFDAFITGSDQVWNVGLGVSKDFYLEFAEPEKKKISYAASFGVSSIPEEHQAETIKGINNIDTISVREESGANIVKQLAGRDAEVVLDPVFLLPPEKWTELEAPLEKIPEKFIFVYPTQVTDTLVSIVRELKNKTGYEAISPFYVPGCKTRKDIGPREFVSLVRNAEYVVGSSFHVTAFSVIFGKKLYVVTHSKTGSRTTDLLRRLNMDSCIIDSAEQIKNVGWQYEAVNETLEKLIADSKTFLKNAFNGE